MKRKNKIEQELDRKEFENEIGKDLHLQYQRLDNQEKLISGKNKYVLAAIHFFGTTFFILGFYFLLKILSIRFSMGYLAPFFGITDYMVFSLAFVLGVIAVYKKRSPLEDIIGKW